MNRSRLRQIFALMLGFLVALGMTVSVVQATTMSLKMATAPGMGAANDGKCDECGNGGSGMKATGCGTAMCASAVVAALPQALSVTRGDPRERSLSTPTLLVGRTFSPQPHPPRLGGIG